MSKLSRPIVIRNSQGIRQVVLGDEETVKLSGEHTNEKFLLIEQHTEPGVSIPLHVHRNEDEVFRVLEGEMQVVVGGKETILGAGDLAYCPKGVPHSWEVVGKQKMKCLLMNFPAGLEFMLAELAALGDEPSFEKIRDISSKYDITFL